MFWQIYNSQASNRAATTANRADKKATTANHKIRNLERRVDALALACQSLWEITSDELNITQEQLLEKMQEVDLRDGEADGRMSVTAQECSDCGRKSNSQRNACLYCGTPFPGNGHVFQV